MFCWPSVSQQQVSEDEIILSDCGLQDLSISPLLEALRSHKTIAMLDLSHNMLGIIFQYLCLFLYVFNLSITSLAERQLISYRLNR